MTLPLRSGSHSIPGLQPTFSELFCRKSKRMPKTEGTIFSVPRIDAWIVSETHIHRQNIKFEANSVNSILQHQEYATGNKSVAWHCEILVQIYELGKLSTIAKHVKTEKSKFTILQLNYNARCISNVPSTDHMSIAGSFDIFKAVICSELRSVQYCYLAETIKNFNWIIPICRSTLDQILIKLEFWRTLRISIHLCQSIMEKSM